METLSSGHIIYTIGHTYFQSPWTTNLKNTVLSRTFGVFPLETPHWRRGVTGRALEQMATHGSLTAFDPSKEDWTSYVLRLKYYFDANGHSTLGWNDPPQGRMTPLNFCV